MDVSIKAPKYTPIFSRERFVEEYDRSGELLVELGSDQTSCHNPFLGGYYPVQVNIFAVLIADLMVVLVDKVIYEIFLFNISRFT